MVAGTSDIVFNSLLTQAGDGEGNTRSLSFTANELAIDFDKDGVLLTTYTNIVLTAIAEGFNDPVFKFTGSGYSNAYITQSVDTVFTASNTRTLDKVTAFDATSPSLRFTVTAQEKSDSSIERVAHLVIILNKEGDTGATGATGAAGVSVTGATGATGPTGPSPSFNVTVNANGFLIDGAGFSTPTQHPYLHLDRGFTYIFNINTPGHAFNIKSDTNMPGTLYSTGVTNNGASSGEIIFEVPMTAPNNLYYQCGTHAAHTGRLFIDNGYGLTGPVGPAGPQGTQGILGPQGPQGPVGIQGTQGPPGIAGIRGPIGPDGPEGGVGLAGIIGQRGPQGPNSNITGPVGPAGPIGGRGPTGPTSSVAGAAGPAGPAGDPGPRGVVGPTGGPGPAGPAGPAGPVGPASTVQGITGPTGPTGAAGPQGPASTIQGPTGPRGDTGPQGPVGAAGPQGPAGTETGPPGLRGPTGDPGPQGPVGTDTGPQGPRGPTGGAGPQGDTGIKGLTGVQGPVGPPGQKGDFGPTSGNIVIDTGYSPGTDAADGGAGGKSSQLRDLRVANGGTGNVQPLDIYVNPHTGNWYQYQGTTTQTTDVTFTQIESGSSGLVASLATKANIAAPAFTGIPTAPTAAANTNTTQIATTAFVTAATAAVGGGGAFLKALQRVAGDNTDPNMSLASSTGTVIDTIRLSASTPIVTTRNANDEITVSMSSSGVTAQEYGVGNTPVLGSNAGGTNQVDVSTGSTTTVSETALTANKLAYKMPKITVSVKGLITSAEELPVYEHGKFVPTVVIGAGLALSGNRTLGQISSNHLWLSEYDITGGFNRPCLLDGYYHRVGRVCYINLRIRLPAANHFPDGSNGISGSGASGGAILIGGFPYVSHADAIDQSGPTGITATSLEATISGQFRYNTTKRQGTTSYWTQVHEPFIHMKENSNEGVLMGRTETHFGSAGYPAWTSRSYTHGTDQRHYVHSGDLSQFLDMAFTGHYIIKGDDSEI
jgi:hypothetical protein